MCLDGFSLYALAQKAQTNCVICFHKLQELPCRFDILVLERDSLLLTVTYDTSERSPEVCILYFNLHFRHQF